MSWKVPLPIAQGFAKKKKKRERETEEQKSKLFSKSLTAHIKKLQ